MPRTTRVYVKTSVFCLGLGAVLGMLMLVSRWLSLGAIGDYVRVPHAQILVVGWLTQLILGVAWWLFPPLAAGSPGSGGAARRGQARRGSERLFWATYALLNGGVVLRAFGDPLYTATRAAFFGFLIALSGLCLGAAAVTFVASMWARVRELGHR